MRITHCSSADNLVLRVSSPSVNFTASKRVSSSRGRALMGYFTYYTVELTSIYQTGATQSTSIANCDRTWMATISHISHSRELDSIHRQCTKSLAYKQRCLVAALDLRKREGWGRESIRHKNSAKSPAAVILWQTYLGYKSIGESISPILSKLCRAFDEEFPMAHTLMYQANTPSHCIPLLAEFDMLRSTF